ncbi:ABC transporter substrate-binding protein [Paraburkholderia caballeronis]|uniref:ABC transporter substrate-binding protein n=1 Tax=Paraburkholderia caballeronis TaxID=416943 RepID=UPI0010649AEA|nr:ABC transporter substrate-binding protein [Paraburkholderia caballeronis]TDV04348.1 iron complex transport system substrate-binding protein [Paraburkholderia caballeronis]TDV17706.1 iron complex transport system substrate-binding protein [Paraburkholderia caballeronis]TDV18736.1 iron complex transport system substrate-binding protein [Paraburkholderia caballeronis]
MSRLTRRQCIACLAWFAVSGYARGNGAAGEPPRIVALTWPAAQTLLTLGIAPVATVDRGEYSRQRLQPDLPASTIELGRYAEPNLELLSTLKPDLILIDTDQSAMTRLFERIAPVQVFSINTDAGRPYQRARELTLALGRQFHREPAARDYLARLDRKVAQTKAALRDLDTRPTFVVDLGADARHVSIYASNSILDDVLQQLGIPNAWSGPSNAWGFVTTGVEALADAGDARLLYLDRGVPTQQALASLRTNPLWSRLAFVKAARVAPLRAIYPFGGLPVAEQMLADLSRLAGPNADLHG